MTSVELNNVGKKYPLRRESRTLGGALFSKLLGRNGQEFWALKDINLTVEKGESIGIIGPNGSGKSTLLKILCGVTSPTVGSVHVAGRVSSLLELGAGFHPYLTGRENVYLNGCILGMPRKLIAQKFADIVAFAEMEEFIDVPVKDYSSGMFVRLAFSVAAHSDPEVLIVDEVLAVGDESFQRKCKDLIRHFKNQGMTIIFVAHDLRMVSALADRVMLLRHGKVEDLGRAEQTVNLYLRTIGDERSLACQKTGRMEVIFNRGQLIILWNGQELTHGIGGHTAFQHRGVWNTSSEEQWKITARRIDGFAASANWGALPVTERWDISCPRDGEIRWRIELDVASECASEYGMIQLMVSSAYCRWLTNLDLGEFKEILSTDTVFRDMSKWLFQRELWAVEKSVRKDMEFTGVIVKPTQSNLIVAGSFMNTDFEKMGRLMRFRSTRLEPGAVLPPGKHLLFDGLIQVGTLADDQLADIMSLLRRTTLLTAGPLALEPNDGHGILSWNGTRLTSGLGVYTSIRSDDIWHDSGQASWVNERLDDRTLRSVGKWHNLPITQEWLFQIETEHRIRWEIQVETTEPVLVDREQANVMLRQEYSCWRLSSGQEGRFPAGFDLLANDEWTRLAEVPLTREGLNLTAESGLVELPKVTLEISGLTKNYSGVIENTNPAHSGRVLQRLRSDGSSSWTLLPGRRLYFSGYISVG